MGVSLEQKKRMVQEVAEVAGEAHSALAAEYRGLTAGDMDRLRVQARESGVYIRVVKNTLAKRAVEGTDFECMKDGFEGPLLLAFSQQDPGSAARVLKDFSKGNDKLVVKMLSVGGSVYPGSEIDRLATLPTYDEAISRLMATMRAPVQKLATTLNEVPGKLVRTLAAVKDAKQ
ncbi:50S ribosomal protein L10 [Sediminicurvatus halobius]|uniref:Large ribosomal subunit protein uL10 n=1 Tax=Sediminicurvatus halobius TaxID=2182432 RepID=A0A2U2MZ71_9GAMM|nr:50S ribosomal protein L10 [Spiribacter halobius]PWG62093.1 50S ribosomal protein L10 [Spiribacter halobius]UEX77223.1 50S ribosomal protein L10 [Spiribacter halobius]